LSPGNPKDTGSSLVCEKTGKLNKLINTNAMDKKLFFIF
jgi:hypothetical protein